MYPSLLRRLALSSIVFFLALEVCQAQTYYPTEENPKVNASAMIEMGKGYISGVCMLKKDGDMILGSIFNEFGISALSFTYDEDRQKVKLFDVVSFMDKWYIRKVMRKDLAKWMEELKKGNDSYVNEKRNITYKLLPLTNEETNDTEE